MNNQTQNIATEQDETDISLFDVLTVIGQYKVMILVITFTFALLAVVVSLMMTPVFTAKTLLIPPQQQNSASTTLAGLSSVAGLSSGLFGQKLQDDLYISFMTSESFQKIIIERFNLQNRYNTQLFIDTRQALNASVRILSDKKSSLMSIEVDDSDPVFAANMANEYVEELTKYLLKFAITEAQQKRLFLENQIKKTQEDLALAESTFRQSQQKSGLQIPSVLGDIDIKEISELNQQIRSRELQLQAMNSFATPQNTEVQKLRTELLAMRAHLSKLEQGSAIVSTKGTLEQGAFMAYRNIKVQESLLETLVKQLESAKIDESKGGPLVQVVDRATPPERRKSPKRTIMVLQSSIAGLIFGLLISFILKRISNISQNSYSLDKLNALIRVWKF